MELAQPGYLSLRGLAEADFLAALARGAGFSAATATGLGCGAEPGTHSKTRELKPGLTSSPT